MTWPNSDVDTTKTDAGPDDPSQARAHLNDLIVKFNQLRNHVSAFTQTFLDDANAAAVFATLGTPVENGTFTATLSGMTATVQGTIYYFVRGRVVTLIAPSAILGTSNAVGMTLSGLPANLQIASGAAQIRTHACLITDNGLLVPAFAKIALTAPFNIADAIIFLLHNGTQYAVNSHTASGTKGLPANWTFTYSLDV